MVSPLCAAAAAARIDAYCFDGPTVSTRPAAGGHVVALAGGGGVSAGGGAAVTGGGDAVAGAGAGAAAPTGAAAVVATDGSELPPHAGTARTQNNAKPDRTISPHPA